MINICLMANTLFQKDDDKLQRQGALKMLFHDFNLFIVKLKVQSVSLQQVRRQKDNFLTKVNRT